MNSQFFKINLRSLRSREEFGATTDAKLEGGRLALLRSLGAEDVARPVYGGQHVWQFVLSFVAESVARPLAVGVSSIVLTLGGWVVAVNASSESVPGDTLYPIKMAAEKVHLTLTTSVEQRTKLQLEFAGRRLAEIKNVQSSTRSGKQVRVQSAVDQFRKEMASVNSHLASVKESNPSEAAALVELVGEKTNAYAATIRKDVAPASDVRADEQVLENVRGAQQDVVSVGQRAVETLVEKQETVPGGESKDDLQNVFRNNLNDLQARVAIVKARLSTIQAVLDRGQMDGELAASARALVSKIRAQLVSVQPDLDKATNQLVAGGFRSAFETLSRLQTTMLVVDDLLVQLEIQISLQPKEEPLPLPPAE
ncbi:hypothetical protein HYW18_04155 [Candidatus Uhrbacteria bacterium]|nr:hypothetical protein [Candidatus Uhrbacteria bacterium]